MTTPAPAPQTDPTQPGGNRPTPEQPAPRPARQDTSKTWKIVLAIVGVLVLIIVVWYIASHNNTPTTAATADTTAQTQITVVVPGTYTFKVNIPAAQNVGGEANFIPSQTTFGSTGTETIVQGQPNPSSQTTVDLKDAF